jgi:DNA polymerase III delta prime subunit
MAEAHEPLSMPRQQLIFVGGPPGVGKTATCDLLYRRLSNSICVDADDLWCRMNPFRVDPITVGMVERNVGAVLRNFLGAGFEYVIMGWVLHQEDIVGRILGALDDIQFCFSWVTLVCDEQVLRQRWASTHAVGADAEHALRRLREAKQLDRTCHIDTGTLSVEAVVQRIIAHVDSRRHQGASRQAWWRAIGSGQGPV